MIYIDFRKAYREVFLTIPLSLAPEVIHINSSIPLYGALRNPQNYIIHPFSKRYFLFSILLLVDPRQSRVVVFPPSGFETQ